MFRKISNRLAGRKKVVDKRMNFIDVRRLLEGLSGAETRINVNYVSGTDYATFRDATPSEVAEFVEKKFEPSSNYYCEANHQVFLGNQDERHYLDLLCGSIIASVGTQESRGNPFIKATLDYVLQKTE